MGRWIYRSHGLKTLPCAVTVVHAQSGTRLLADVDAGVVEAVAVAVDTTRIGMKVTAAADAVDAGVDATMTTMDMAGAEAGVAVDEDAVGTTKIGTAGTAAEGMEGRRLRR